MNTRSMAKGLLLGAAVAIALAAPASAHRRWVLPSTFTLSGDEQWITVDAASSNDLFFPNHRPFPLADIAVIAPDGEALPVEGGWTGEFRSSFDLKLDQQGTYRISGGRGAVTARWQENGENRQARGDVASLREQGVFERDGVSFSYNDSRVETFVTLGAPTETALAPTGRGLELQPVTHPNDVYEGEEATFKLLANGAPAAGLDVVFIADHDRYRDDLGEIHVTTADDGGFSVTFPGPGRYWMDVSAESEAVTIDGVEMPARMSYSATFEALPL